MALRALFALIFLANGSPSAQARAEMLNGDSLCSLSLNPSPERINESVLRESPLEMSILLPLETARVLG
jgi:hypothetical protein